MQFAGKTFFVPLIGIIGILIFFYGCLGSVGSDQFGENYIAGLERVSAPSPEACPIGNCWCMVCENTQFEYLFGPARNLIGGSCHFNTECTPEVFTDLASDDTTPTLSIRQFMLGQGASFADFAEANPYCADKLTMAVQWLTGDENTEYPVPDAPRTMCFLSKDVLPVFVLYSNGENIDADRAEDIGEVLGTQGDDFFAGRLSTGPVGPVIVVTEIDFDREDIPLIAEQVRAVNRGCRNDRASDEINCMIAVAPKMGDTETLDMIMEEVGDEVDLIAFGVNGRDTESCDGARIVYDVEEYAAHALYHWNKPTIIPYIMFDSSGTNADGSCTWTENRMIAAYSSFFPTNIISLQQRGVIGIAPYSFNSNNNRLSNPLECTSCGLGANEQRTQSWYSWCQRFNTITELSPTGDSIRQSGSIPIAFSDEAGGSCNSNNGQLAYLVREISFSDSLSTRDIMSPNMPELADPTDNIFTCDACVVYNHPENPDAPITPAFSGIHAADLGEPVGQCDIYPEIDRWASQRNLDPMLVRAFIISESGFSLPEGFDVCEVAEVHEVGTGGLRTSSGADECYEKGYNFITDPTGECDELPSAPTVAPGADTEMRYCGLGMMQILEPPIEFWPATYRQDGVDGVYVDYYTDVVSRGMNPNLEFAQSCNPVNFNPFNIDDALCVGTAKIEASLNYARQWISTHRSELGWGAEQYEKDNVLAAYIAGHDYVGFWRAHSSTNRDCIRRGIQSHAINNGDCWVANFNERSTSLDASTVCVRDDDGNLPAQCSGVGELDRDNCYGYTDFVEYVRACEIIYLPREADPGANKLSIYYWLINHCDNSFCPEGRRMLSTFCEPDENGYVNPQFCDTTTGFPLYPDSHNPYMPDLAPSGP
ncbi:hypothetical protein KKF81_00120 [Candidatus Micrarchaeota archaeon]|nr:hypothetical protein [Candidatus Micrarchaeota archaeon]MBU1165322.1 hypothetical protein [Candidatus Micrarchaeota archaeon]MBU1887117.1 hypothetical protein [Candidatus Micrarchaeota archaeon]